jgi:large conductance mechanosensitive channel
MNKILEEFKAFIMKGNILALAVAFVIGVAFTTLVQTTTHALVQPILGLLTGGPDMPWLNFKYLRLGDFLIGVINFLITAAVIFFVFVKPMTRFGLLPEEEKKDAAPPPPPPPPADK